MSSISIAGDTSGSVILTVPAAAGSSTITLPAGTGTAAVQGVSTNIVTGTAVASTSGTTIDFTGIPSWAKRITVMFNGVSTSGTSNLLVRIGTSSGFVSTGYVSGSWGANTTNASDTTGFLATGLNGATRTNCGLMIICSHGSNIWTESVTIFSPGSNDGNNGGGYLSLGGTLDRVRVTTVNGTDTFDAGSINIMYE